MGLLPQTEVSTACSAQTCSNAGVSIPHLASPESYRETGAGQAPSPVSKDRAANGLIVRSGPPWRSACGGTFALAEPLAAGMRQRIFARRGSLRQGVAQHVQAKKIRRARFGAGAGDDAQDLPRLHVAALLPAGAPLFRPSAPRWRACCRGWGAHPREASCDG